MDRWKTYISLLLFWHIFSPNAYSQDLSGKWTGYLSQVVQGKKQRLYFEMQLTQDGNMVSGASMVARNDTTTCTSVIRGTWNNEVLHYSELKFIKIRGGISEENWCLKKCTFKFSRKGNEELLIGHWNGQTKLDEWCEPGLIVAKRPATALPVEAKIKEGVSIIWEANISIADPLGNPASGFVEIKDEFGELKYAGEVAEEGLKVSLEQGMYHVSVKQKGYLDIYKDLRLTPENTDWKFNLSKLKKGDRFVIYGLYFEQSQAIITPESKPALARLARFLMENPQCVIRIVGHTDNVGNAYLNRILSLNRARAVAKYLVVEAGIAGARVKEPEGKGGDEPIVAQPEAPGHSQNRRVEVEIVEIVE